MTTHVSVFLKDDDTITASEPLKSDGTVVIRLDASHNTQVFIGTREQAERLFDVVSEVALSFRERFPAESFPVDAVIGAEDDAERVAAGD